MDEDTPMHATQIDPRGIDRTDQVPSYVVIFWEQGTDPAGAPAGYAADEWLLSDVDDLADVVQWIEERRAGREVELLVGLPSSTAGAGTESSYVRLMGADPTEVPWPS